MEPLTPNPRATQAPRGCDGYAIREPGYSIHDALALHSRGLRPPPMSRTRQPAWSPFGGLHHTATAKYRGGVRLRPSPNGLE